MATLFFLEKGYSPFPLKVKWLLPYYLYVKLTMKKYKLAMIDEFLIKFGLVLWC